MPGKAFPVRVRDLEMNQRTAWFLQQRIRAERARMEKKLLLQGIVAVDETCVGGKPRKDNHRQPCKASRRGRGTARTPVIGAVERDGKVVAQGAPDLSARGVLGFIRKAVDPRGTVLITDEYPACKGARYRYRHAVIKHTKPFVEGFVHTNSLESFWALVKRAWYGTHHHDSKAYRPRYGSRILLEVQPAQEPQSLQRLAAGVREWTSPKRLSPITNMEPSGQKYARYGFQGAPGLQVSWDRRRTELSC